jgi:hypothetical protein
MMAQGKIKSYEEFTYDLSYFEEMAISEKEEQPGQEES